MKTSENINELAAALAKAQGEFPPIPKDCTAKVTTKKGGEYTFQYADLETILHTIRPVLAKHQLALSLSPELRANEQGGMRAVVTTVLVMHSSGQWVRTEGLAVAIYAEASPDSRRSPKSSRTSTSGVRYWRNCRSKE